VTVKNDTDVAFAIENSLLTNNPHTVAPAVHGNSNQFSKLELQSCVRA
jgi:hypothetical protein